MIRLQLDIELLVVLICAFMLQLRDSIDVYCLSKLASCALAKCFVHLNLTMSYLDENSTVFAYMTPSRMKLLDL